MNQPPRLPLDSETEVTGRLPRERLALLFSLSMVASAGNVGMQSIMPALGAALGVSDVWVSISYTWPAVLWVISAPYWARRSDRRGRKALMKLGMAGYVGSFALCTVVVYAGLQGLIAAGWTLMLFALCRTVYSAVGSAMPTAAQAYVTSRTPRHDRTRVLALLASAFGIGTVIGPGLAPLIVLPGLGLATPFLVFMLMGLVMQALLQWRLPDDAPAYPGRGAPAEEPLCGAGLPPIVDEPVEPAGGAPRLRWLDLRLRPWIAAGIAGGHAHSALIGVTGFLVIDRLGLRGQPELAAGPIGIVMMSGAAATLLAQWGLIPTFRLGPRGCTIWGMVLATAGVLLLGAGHQLHAIVLGYSLASLGFGLFRPGFAAGASLAVSREEQGQVAGIVTSVNGMGFILAPVGGVWLYNHQPWTAFAATALLCLAVIAIALSRVAPDEAFDG